MSTSSLRRSLHNITKWPRRENQIKRMIRILKDEDKLRWKSDYYSGDVHGVGHKYQNLGKYLKKKRVDLPRTYRDRAITRIQEDEQEARAVQQQNDALIGQIGLQDQRERERELHHILFQRRYADGVELRLALEGLSSEAIEQRSIDGQSVADDLVRRHERAPIILREILAEADREHEEMMERIQERQPLEEERDESPRQDSDDDFEERLRSLSGEGRGRIKKTRMNKMRRKKNTNPHRTKKNRVYGSRKKKY